MILKLRGIPCVAVDASKERNVFETFAESRTTRCSM